MNPPAKRAQLDRLSVFARPRQRWMTAFALVIGLLTLVACYPAMSPGSLPTTNPTVAPAIATPTAAPARPPVASILGNLTYAGVLAEPITLRDGVAEYSDGSSGRPSIRLAPDAIVTGDLDADGNEDAVAVLRNETSGTGRFVYLVAVRDVFGAATPTQALMIGDRIIVNSLAVRDGELEAALVVQGPNDGLCCPTVRVTRTFVLINDELIERADE